MKLNLLTSIAFCFVAIASYAQPKAMLVSYTPTNAAAGFRWEFTDLFEESDVFSDGASFIWADYQVFSTLGTRDDKTRSIIPPVGLHYEKHLFYNIGLRLDANLSVWEEEKVLAQTPDFGIGDEPQTFTELFEYRYWTAALGGNYHFTVDDNWDPYVGVVASYRQTRAFCDCVDESRSEVSFDFLVGTRYFLDDHFYFTLEVGQHGVGFVSGGLGFKID